MRWSEELLETMKADRRERADKDPESTKAQLLILGSGASCGVPTFYCNCKACREAAVNPRAVRTNAAAAIVRNEVTLIDAGPDIHKQLQGAGIRDVNRVLFTHEHVDHVGGILQFEYYVILKRLAKLDFYCNRQTSEFIASHYDFMADTFEIHEQSIGDRLEFDGISYTPIAARHCPGAFGYLIDVPAAYSTDSRDKKVAYIPDTAWPCQQTCQIVEGADILVVDATYNGGNWTPEQHLSIDDAVALAGELGVGQCYLTHLSMQFDEPITTEELDNKIDGTNVYAAYDGLRISL